MTSLATAPILPAFKPVRSQAEFDKERNIRQRQAIKIGRMLHNGEWRELLLDIRNKLTQFDYRSVKNVHGTVNALLVKINFIETISRKHADVLLNQPPVISVPIEFTAQAEAWEEIEDHCLVVALLHEMTITANIDSMAWLQIVIEDGHVCIVGRDSLECFPVGPVEAGGQPKIADRRWTIKTRGGGDKRERYFLRVERHTAGLVENLAYLVSSGACYEIPKDAKPVDLRSILGEDAPSPVEQTGASRPLLFRFAPHIKNREPVPDITKNDLDFIDWLAAISSQLARIISKHADPKFRVPSALVNDKGQVESKKLEAFTDPGKEAEYISYDAKFLDVLSVVEKLINWLMIKLEMSPSLLGIKAGGAAESYEKLFLESLNTMSRAHRIANTWQPLLERMILTALEVHQAKVSLFGYPLAPVSVNLRPGLPRTDGETNRELAEMHQSGQLSQLSMLEQIHGEGKAGDELTRLNEEATRNAAQFLGERTIDEPAVPGAGDERGDGEVPGDDPIDINEDDLNA